MRKRSRRTTRTAAAKQCSRWMRGAPPWCSAKPSTDRIVYRSDGAAQNGTAPRGRRSGAWTGTSARLVGRRRRARCCFGLDLVAFRQLERRNGTGAVTAAHCAPQAAIQVRMRFLEVADDLEVDALDLRKVDLLDVHQAQQLAHGLRHLATAFVAGSAALRDADLRPELFLIQS